MLDEIHPGGIDLDALVDALTVADQARRLQEGE